MAKKKKPKHFDIYLDTRNGDLLVVVEIKNTLYNFYLEPNSKIFVQGNCEDQVLVSLLERDAFIRIGNMANALNTLGVELLKHIPAP